MIISLDRLVVKTRRISRLSTAFEAGVRKWGSSAHLRFITLTSSPSSTRPISKSFQILMKRLKRRFEYTDFQYIRVKTDEGFGVLHIVMRGRYIPQADLSAMWLDIHDSPIVDIRSLYYSKGLKNYLNPYLQGQSTRMSYSKNWVYPGWRANYKEIARRIWYFYYPKGFFIRNIMCLEYYIKKLYYFYKTDIINNSLIPVLRT